MDPPDDAPRATSADLVKTANFYLNIKYSGNKYASLERGGSDTVQQAGALQGVEAGQLWARVHEAENLWIEEDVKKPKARRVYVVFTLLPSDQKIIFETKIVKTPTGHPKFFQEVIFPVQSISMQRLGIVIMEEKSFPTKPKILGVAELVLSKFAFQKTQNLTIPITETPHDNAELKMLITFTPTMKLLPEPIIIPKFMLFLERTSYFAGEIIFGAVVLNIAENTKFKQGLGLVFQGFQKVSSTHITNTTGGNKQGKDWKYIRHILNSGLLLETSKSDIRGYHQPGSYYFPFKYSLPQVLPPSGKWASQLTLEQAKYNCSYRVCLSSNNESLIMVPFDVDINYTSSPNYVDRSPKLTAKIEFDKEPAYFGTTITATITVTNKGKKKLRGCRVKLISTYVLKGSFQQYHNKQTLFKTKMENPDGQFPIHLNQTKILSVKIPIPSQSQKYLPTLGNPTHTHSCNNIHSVVFKFERGGLKGSYYAQQSIAILEQPSLQLTRYCPNPPSHIPLSNSSFCSTLSPNPHPPIILNDNNFTCFHSGKDVGWLLTDNFENFMKDEVLTKKGAELGLLPTVNIGEFVERNILKIGNSSVDDYFVGLAKKHDEPIEKNLYIQPKLNRLQRSYSDTSALAPQGRNQNQQGFFAVART